MTFYDAKMWLYWVIVLYIVIFLVWNMIDEKDIKQQFVAGFAAMVFVLRLLFIK